MAAPRHFRGADSDSEMADIEDEAYEAPQRYGYGPNALVPHDGAGSVNGEDDGGDGDDQHRERWSYVWLLDLLDRSFHDPSCITLAEAIRALPTSSLTQLRATLQRVLQLPHATSLDAEAWRRALSVFGLEVLRSLHPMLQQKLLRHLHDLEDHLQYWKEETRHPLRRFVERGPTHWLKASRGPQGVITQGFRAWLSRVAWTERTAATELLLDLELLKDGWLEEVAHSTFTFVPYSFCAGGRSDACTKPRTSCQAWTTSNGISKGSVCMGKHSTSTTSQRRQVCVQILSSEPSGVRATAHH